ncbi:endonuclease/exonuclease/phosphatase family protein [Aliivibrio logei]|uniref:endonuclease/exonuclease/phosphatase family protein n=1 Tax=Aliivibrio logei TaxID=688 RepID=UPI00039C42F9
MAKDLKIKFIICLLLLLPICLWRISYHVSDIWWIENITGIPSAIATVYYSGFILFLIFRYYLYSFCSLLLAFLCSYQKPAQLYSNIPCSDPLKIVQYNLFYTNPDLSPFLTYLTENDIDLVILQETSPWHGDRFMEITDNYPYQFGGSPGLGYPSGQMIISKQPINLRAQNTPAGHFMISGVWQSSEKRPISLYTAHPPSPRTKQLWYERNALIESLERLADYSPYSDTLIIGDFNLSSNTKRFVHTFEEYDTAPVASWPMEITGISIPKTFRIAIDHLWLRNIDTNSLSICKREVLPQFSGSDHLAVLTYLSTKKESF